MANAQNNTTVTRVFEEDLKKLRFEVREILVKIYPMIKDMKMSDAVLFRFVIKHAMGDDDVI